MRATVAVAMAALLLCSWPQTIAQPVSAQCGPRSEVLGVSRVVEIDGSSGPRFGHLQYKDEHLLQDGEVVLTFDDGPSRQHTPAILAALDAHCTKATFFSVGRMAIADPEMLRETARRGHTIGTHTWSHRNIAALSPTAARYEIELGISAVRAALGKPVAPFFRFPYLSDPQSARAHLQERGIAVFSIDADSYDYKTPSGAVIQRNILQQLSQKKKGILLFHDIQASTARGLKGLLDELHARGFRVVHLVPKGPVATVAEFDALADQVLGKKQVAESHAPLARRSVVWPLTSEPATTSAPHASPATRPVRRHGGDDDWKTRVFGD